MHWLAQAPANIALIKYMGKKDEHSNLPDNSSLSYTLNNLLSTVTLEPITTAKDIWEPLNIPGAADFHLAEQGQKRFLNHLQRIKNYFGYEGGFLVQSSNNFPHSSGLASSASSFAALTKCATRALSELTGTDLPSTAEQARLSRQGSGSSCRSFYTPWALWRGDEVNAIELPYMQLHHQVVVISGEEKEVSSSEAHKRVKNSPSYSSRPQRAEDNLKSLLNVLRAKEWQAAYQICWREFQDMHQLFATSPQPFHYMTDRCHELLKILQHFWEQKGDGPLITMDAGPNIHLLYREDQYDLSQEIKQNYLVGNYDVL